MNTANLLPVEIVLSPAWWHRNEQMDFDEDFFYHPQKRIESEQKMEQVLYERWGRFGLGRDRKQRLPIIGPVHLASGYILSEVLGCDVKYCENSAPLVVPANLKLTNIKANYETPSFLKLYNLIESMKKTHGFVVGDLNWSGILNLALDVYGQQLFIDIIDDKNKVTNLFDLVAGTIDNFTNLIDSLTSTTSISVNRNIANFSKKTFLHSQCSHTMISEDQYTEHLLKYDIEWSHKHNVYGIHFCGKDPHRFAKQFAKIPNLAFLDVGSGGDVKLLREYLPRTFFSIRLSPVDIITQSKDEIRQNIITLVRNSGNLISTGLCCINIDEKVSDDKITTIFETANEIRNNTNYMIR